MTAVPCSLLRVVQTYRAGQAAVTDVSQGKSWTFGELVAFAARCRSALARLGLEPGDTVESDLAPGGDFAALLLACWETGLQLKVKPPGASARSGRDAAPAKLLVSRAPKSPSKRNVRQFTIAELEEFAAARSSRDPVDNPAAATITAGPLGAAETMQASALLQSAANFNAACHTTAGETLLSTSAPFTLEDVCISTVIPLALGLHVIIAGEIANENVALLSATAARATLCELSAPTLHRLLEHNKVPHLPTQIRTVFCSSSGPSAGDIARAEAALGRPLHRGYGTPKTGFWAVVAAGGVPAQSANYVAAIRELRSPLRLQGADEACKTGEIVLRPVDDEAPTVRTGDVGWLTQTNTLEVAGKLSDVSVRRGQAILLTDLDRLLSSHGSIRESRTFLERGMLPTEPVICVCATDASEAAVREWLVDELGPDTVPSRVMTLAADVCSALPDVDALRSMATGEGGQAVVAALTARRFRRNPAYDEAGLAAAVDTALLSGNKLEFLMFWGCGPRRHASAPDHAAIDALGEILSAAEAAARLQAHARVICTDLHATNNGHAESHFLTYFSEIRGLATSLDADFELESAVWRRGGLTRNRILAFEQEHEFEQRWQNFPLQGRFIHQASRHSGLTDKTAAARHYYATCLLERDVLKSLFAGSVFLTYNGPEFNECFPDLPTLYVYPGPRGRNDKPWFIDGDEQQTAHAAQVAAE